MTENTPNNVPASSVDMLAETYTLYRWTALELIRLINSLKSGQNTEARGADAKAAGQTIRDLRIALGWAIDESSHVEKIGKSLAASGGNGAELDLDSARDEIGRRISRLRAAGDERGVSGEPE
jgi:hypothetical protein